jgi:ribosomal protein S18 acetylase RimI-like enzyme
MPPELAKREYYLWRNLQAVFEDVNPNNLWLVNTRLRQLASVLPPSVQRPVQGPWSEDRLKTLLAAAEQSTGEKRDNYLAAAAFTTWRFGDGDLDKAITLIDKISDPKVRDENAGTIYLQAGTKYLRSEGPDYVLELARKSNLPGPRVRLFLAVIGSLENVKATERIDSVRRELLSWLRNCERNSDTAWALLDYLDASISDLTENKFAAFELLVRVLNSPGLETNAGIKNRVY